MQRPVQAQLQRLEKSLPQLTLQGMHPWPVLALEQGVRLPRCWNWLERLLTVKQGTGFQHWGSSCLACSLLVGKGWSQPQYPTLQNTSINTAAGPGASPAGSQEWLPLRADGWTSLAGRCS